MENITEDKIYKLIGLDKFKRSSMARYFGRLTENERIESVSLAYDLARQNMQKVDDSLRGKPEYFYSMICLALWKMNWTREIFAKKNPDLTAEQAEEIAKRRMAGILSARKDRAKRGRLKVLLETRFYYVVQKLRNEGISWRECIAYLKKYHRTQISHVQLRKLFYKIKDEKIKRGEII